MAGEKTIMLDVNAERVKSGIESARGYIKERLENGLASRQQAERAYDLLLGGSKQKRQWKGQHL